MNNGEKLTVIITGPSGVGKDTIAELLLSDASLSIARVLRHTNRNARKGEDGVTHRFVSTEKFLQLVSEGAFIEWNQTGVHYYGTSFSSYKSALDQNQRVVLAVGVLSALKLKDAAEAQIGKTLMAFLSPVKRQDLFSGDGIAGAIEALKRRIKNRSSLESETEIADRIKTAREDLWRARLFANIIACEDGRVQETAAEVKKLILEQ